MRKPAFLSNERLSRFLVSLLLCVGLLVPLMLTFGAQSALALGLASAAGVTVACVVLGAFRRGRLLLAIAAAAAMAA